MNFRAAAALFVLTAVSAHAHAGASVDIDHVQLAATSSSFVATEGAGTVEPWAWRIAAAYRYVDRPLNVDVGGERSPLLARRSVLEVAASVQLGKWVGLGLVLPALVDQVGSAADRHAALGDLRIVPRIEIVHTRSFGMAALLGVRAPTGATGQFFGEGMAVFEPRIALQGSFANERVAIGVNLGVRIRESRLLYDVRVGNEALASVALAITPIRYVTGLAEVQLATALDRNFAQKQTSPVEVLLGARGGAAGATVSVVVGLGAADGFGAPRVRAMAMLEYRRAAKTAAAPIAPPVPRPPPPAPAPAPEPEPEPEPVVAEAPTPEPTPEPLVESHPEEPDVKFVAGRIELGKPVFFKLNRRRVRSEFRPELVQLARAIARRPTISVVWIEGHADRTGPEPWNLELSRNRSAEVARFLVAQGIDASRLRPVGFGEARPLVPTPPRTENERNRRVQFFTDVVAPEPKTPAAPERQAPGHVAAIAEEPAGVDP